MYTIAELFMASHYPARAWRPHGPTPAPGALSPPPDWRWPTTSWRLRWHLRNVPTLI